jgi:hypothetical protein
MTTLNSTALPGPRFLTAWDDLLDEFRALGGTAENIRLDQGQFGRGVFPVDPAKPIAIRVPDSLLVAKKNMVFVDGMPRVGPAATAKDREKAWLDRYQAEFAWGAGGKEGISRVFEMAAALPAELRRLLLTKYGCGAWFLEPTDALIQQRYFETRTITYRDQSVVMPLIELVNHGDGPRYDLSDGVAFRGSFPGEAFVQYSDLDSFDYFLSWGFATQRPAAFSVGLHGSIGAARLEVGQTFNERVTSERSWIPEIRKNGDGVSVSFLMIGNDRLPRLPKGIFYRLMRDAGYAGFEEAFDMVHHVNRLHFLGLIEELEPFDLPIARILRTMARYQLRAMSSCYGVREI